jgi:hypothetical protein
MNQMRSSQKNRNARNKNGRHKPQGNVVNRVYESAGPEGKVRGTPQQIIEKYLVLARDAQTSGDRVTAENFLQHAEHYIRLLNAAMPAQDQMRFQGQQPSQQDDGDGYDEIDGDGGEPLPQHRAPEPRGWEQRGEPRQGEGRPQERPEARHGEGRPWESRQPEFRSGDRQPGDRQPADRGQERRGFEPRQRDEQRGNRDEQRGNRDEQRGNRDEQRGNRDEQRGYRTEPRPPRDDQRLERGPAPEPVAEHGRAEAETPAPAAVEGVLSGPVGAALAPAAPPLPGLETIDAPETEPGPVATPETMAEAERGEDDKPKSRRRTRKPRPTEEVPAE